MSNVGEMLSVLAMEYQLSYAAIYICRKGRNEWVVSNPLNIKKLMKTSFVGFGISMFVD